MKIIVGCEYSGIVRDAFAARGHDVVSCDLLETERPGNHLICDVLTLLDQHWDMGIFFPPCTYLCNSGVRWLSNGSDLNPERLELMHKACDFFALLYHAPIPKVCIENPVMHKYARLYLWNVRKVPLFSFSIQPWQHGHPEVKRTCFWTRGLPNLQPSNVVSGRSARVHCESPGPNRWRERSRTLKGVAAAMAAQWSQDLSFSQLCR